MEQPAGREAGGIWGRHVLRLRTCPRVLRFPGRELLSGYTMLPVRRKGRRVHKMGVYLSLKVSMINLYQGCAVFQSRQPCLDSLWTEKHSVLVSRAVGKIHEPQPRGIGGVTVTYPTRLPCHTHTGT